MPVDAYDGHWFRTDVGSPALALLKRFEKNVSDRMSAGRSTPVVFSIPSKGARYKRELVAAKRMLESAEWDYDLAQFALDVLFTDRAFSFKTRDTLLGVTTREFPLALAIARSDLSAKRSKQAVEAATLSAVLHKEDVFA